MSVPAAGSAALAVLAGVLACTGSDRGRDPERPDRRGSADVERWHRVDGRAQLLDALAGLGSRGVVLDVSASWCVPCVELRRTFADARVKAALADYATVELDVSKQSDDQLALGEFFGVSALPLVLRYDDAAALRAALISGTPIAPSLAVRTFVTPDELLAALAG
jgi:thiol:disulfide interchange protein